MNRRKFVKAVGAGMTAMGVADSLFAAKPGKSIQHLETGRRGAPAMAFDCLVLGQRKEEQSFELMDAALDHGLSYWDTAMVHVAGRSERRMGKYLSGKSRESVFIQSRTKARSKAVTSAQLNLSLARLRTDYIDSFLVNSVVYHRVDDQFEIPPLDNFEALIEAKEAGKIRKVGIRSKEDTTRLFELLELYQSEVDVVMVPFGSAGDSRLLNTSKRYDIKIVAEADRKLQASMIEKGAKGSSLPDGLSAWVMSMGRPMEIAGVQKFFNDLNRGV